MHGQRYQVCYQFYSTKWSSSHLSFTPTLSPHATSTVAYRLFGDVHGRELFLVLDGLDLAPLGPNTHPDNVIQEVTLLLNDNIVILVIAVFTLMESG